MMKTQEIYMQEAEEKLLHTYNRFPVVFEHGEDVHLVDTDGKKYLDFAAGIAVSALGYSNQEFKDALKDQVEKLLHTSNLYYNLPVAEAAEKLTEIADMDRVFFTNSGTEAIEGALKVAKKYAYTRDGHAGHEVIAMDHSFHGRSLGALSVTGTKHYQEPFEPLVPGIRFAKFNDLDSVKALINDKTCAILMETLQGEGGIYPADPEFLKGVRALCDEHDILLILDEIQCGMGRTGSMFAWQAYGVKPDVMTVAKAIGSGVPVGAFLMTEKVAKQSLVPGDHGTTYGGNPLAGRAVSTVIDIFKKENIVAHAKEMGEYLTGQLTALMARHESVKAVRGMGLIQGIVLSVPVGDVIRAALAKGLLVISAGTDVLRIVPPLVIEKEHIDEMIGILDAVLTDEENKG